MIYINDSSVAKSVLDELFNAKEIKELRRRTGVTVLYPSDDNVTDKNRKQTIDYLRSKYSTAEDWSSLNK